MRTTRLLAVTFLAVAMPWAAVPSVHAADPAAQCAAVKRKAAGTKALKKLRCHASAVLGGGAVDPLCLARAESRFLSTIQRIEDAGGCASTGDATLLESYVDTFVGQVVGAAGVSTTSTSTTSTVVPETTSTTFNRCGGAGTTCGPCPPPDGHSICYDSREGGGAACPSLNTCEPSTCTTNAECPAGKSCLWNYFAPFEATCCATCSG